MAKHVIYKEFPFNICKEEFYLHNKSEKGENMIEQYVHHVFIVDNCEDLISEYLSFCKDIVKKNKGSKKFKISDFFGAVKHYDVVVKCKPGDVKFYSNCVSC